MATHPSKIRPKPRFDDDEVATAPSTSTHQIPVWKKQHIGTIEVSEFGEQSPHAVFFDIVQRDAADAFGYDTHTLNEYEFTDNAGTVKLIVEQTGRDFNK